MTGFHTSDVWKIWVTILMIGEFSWNLRLHCRWTRCIVGNVGNRNDKSVQDFFKEEPVLFLFILQSILLLFPLWVTWWCLNYKLKSLFSLHNVYFPFIYGVFFILLATHHVQYSRSEYFHSVLLYSSALQYFCFCVNNTLNWVI